jgi:hypothetical protein
MARHNDGAMVVLILGLFVLSSFGNAAYANEMPTPTTILDNIGSGC